MPILEFFEKPHFQFFVCFPLEHDRTWQKRGVASRSLLRYLKTGFDDVGEGRALEQNAQMWYCLTQINWHDFNKGHLFLPTNALFTFVLIKSDKKKFFYIWQIGWKTRFVASKSDIEAFLSRFWLIFEESFFYCFLFSLKCNQTWQKMSSGSATSPR